MPNSPRAIFVAAIEQPAADRLSWVRRACGDDEDLRRRVQELLTAHSHEGDSFLEQPALALASTALASGSEGTLGDFRLVREIGRGGMGIVYEAEQISLKRRVALKVLPFAAVLDKRQLQRFKTEAMAAARLHHQHIVPVYQVGCERAVHFYAMQYIDGRNVAELIRETRRRAGLAVLDQEEPAEPFEQTQIHRPASEGPAADTAKLGDMSTDYSAKRSNYHRRIAELGIQAAGALDFAHHHGILHRDIKPSNLMLDSDGELWVTDFGLARIEGDEGLTMSGDLLGTLRYMSPEQALGKRVVIDQRTDIYSLGVSLYEMLTLRPAYTGADRAELLRQISFETPPSLRKLDPSIPADLETIVLTAMAREPHRRYEAAQELADDLRRFLDGKPIVAKPPSRREHVQKWIARNRSLTASLVLLLLAVIASAVAISATLREPSMTSGAALAVGPAAAQPSSEPAPGPQAPYEGEFLPGLVPKPFRIPSTGRWQYTGRWQVTTDLPHGVVETAAWSPDETKIAYGDTAHLRICDAKDLSLLRVLVGHDRHVTCVAWHPDGTQIGSSSWDGTIRLWSADGAPTHVLKGHKGRVYRIAWRPGGQQLASCGEDGTVRLWNREGTQVKVLKGHRDQVFCLAWSPDGKLLASAGGDIRPPDERGDPGDNSIRLWDVDSERVVSTFTGHRHSVQCVAWHEDGKRLCSGDGEIYRIVDNPHQWREIPQLQNTSVRTWNIDGSAGPLQSGQASIYAVAWQPGTNLLAFGGRTNVMHLWDTSGSKAPMPTQTGLRDVKEIQWNRQGTQFLTASRAGPGVWTSDGQSVVSHGKYTENFPTLDWSPDGQWIATDRGWLWREDGVSVNASHAYRWSPDGKWLAEWGRLWKSDGTQGPSFPIGSSPIYDLAWHPTDGRIAAATDGSVRMTSIDDIGDRGLATDAVNLTGPVQAVAWSPDGHWLAAAGWSDAAIRIWDSDEKFHRLLKGHRGGIKGVHWSPDSHWLVSAGGDSVRLWRPDGTPGPAMNGHDDEVSCVAWSADGKWIASGSTDGTVRLWHSDGHPGPVLSANTIGLRSLAWSPDSRRVVVGSFMDGTVRVWDVDTQQVVWVAICLDRKQGRCTFGTEGMLLNADPSNAEQSLLYLVERRSGAMEIATSDEFKERVIPILKGHLNVHASALIEQGRTAELDAGIDLLLSLAGAPRFDDPGYSPAWLDSAPRGSGVELVMVLGTISSKLQTSERLQKAIDLDRHMVTLCRRFAAQNPAYPAHLLNLVSAQMNLGLCLHAAGKHEDAQEALHECVEICKRAIQDDPDEHRHRASLANAYLNLGTVVDEISGQETAWKESLAIFQQLVREFPENTNYLDGLARANHNVGNVLLETGRLDEAEVEYRRAAETFEALAQKHNLSRYFQIMSRCAQGMALLHLNRPQDAETVLRPLLTIAEELSSQALTTSDRREAKSALCTVASSFGILEYRLGNWGAAQDQFARAHEIDSAEFEKDGDLRFYGAMLAWQLGQQDEARRLFHEDVEWLDQNPPAPGGRLPARRAEAAALLEITDESAIETIDDPAAINVEVVKP